MFKINLVVKVIFLGLLVKFGNISCMDVAGDGLDRLVTTACSSSALLRDSKQLSTYGDTGCGGAGAGGGGQRGSRPTSTYGGTDGGCGGAGGSRRSSTVDGSSAAFAAGALEYFARAHRLALENPENSGFCLELFGEGATPWVGAPTVAAILARIVTAVGGGDAAPTRVNLRRRAGIEEAIVLDAVDRLIKIGNAHNPMFLWVFCRFVDSMIKDRGGSATFPWFARIPAVGDVPEYLSGRAGIVTIALATIVRGDDLSALNTREQGPTIYDLSLMFGRAALLFPQVLLSSRQTSKSTRSPSVQRPTAPALFGIAVLEADCHTHSDGGARAMAAQLVDAGVERERLRTTLAAAESQRELLRVNNVRLEGNVSRWRRFRESVSCWLCCCCCLDDPDEDTGAVPHIRTPTTETTPLMRGASVNGSL